MSETYKGLELNILFVKHGGRTACLLDSENDNENEALVAYAENLKLCTRKIDDKVTLITRKKVTGKITDARLGQLLDFLCYNHEDFWDNHADRYAVSISVGGHELQNEFCVASKVTKEQIETHVEGVIKRWKKVVAKLRLNLDVTSHIHLIISVGTKLKYLESRNINIVFEIKDEYINDLWNFQGNSVLFQLMLKGCSEPNDLLSFIDELTSFYQYAVVEQRLIFPENISDDDERSLSIERGFLCQTKG